MLSCGRLQLKRACILNPTKLEWTDYAVQAKCGNQSGKLAHMQLDGGTLVHSHLIWLSHHGLRMEFSARADLRFKKKNPRQGMICHTFPQNPRRRKKPSNQVFPQLMNVKQSCGRAVSRSFHSCQPAQWWVHQTLTVCHLCYSLLPVAACSGCSLTCRNWALVTSLLHALITEISMFLV